MTAEQEPVAWRLRLKPEVLPHPESPNPWSLIHEPVGQDYCDGVYVCEPLFTRPDHTVPVSREDAELAEKALRIAAVDEWNGTEPENAMKMSEAADRLSQALEGGSRG